MVGRILRNLYAVFFTKEANLIRKVGTRAQAGHSPFESIIDISPKEERKPPVELAHAIPTDIGENVVGRIDNKVDKVTCLE